MLIKSACVDRSMADPGQSETKDDEAEEQPNTQPEGTQPEPDGERQTDPKESDSPESENDTNDTYQSNPDSTSDESRSVETLDDEAIIETVETWLSEADPEDDPVATTERVEELNSEINSLRTEVESVKSDTSTLRTELNSSDDTDDEISSLKQRMNDLETNLNDIQRRSEKEREEIRKYAVEEFAKEIIDVKTSFEIAIDVEDFQAETEEQMRLLNDEFEQALLRGNVEMIDDTDEEFDPLRHEPVDRVKRESEEHNSIVEIRRPGYEMSGRVLEAAKVILAV